MRPTTLKCLSFWQSTFYSGASTFLRPQKSKRGWPQAFCFEQNHGSQKPHTYPGPHTQRTHPLCAHTKDHMAQS